MARGKGTQSEQINKLAAGLYYCLATLEQIRQVMAPQDDTSRQELASLMELAADCADLSFQMPGEAVPQTPTPANGVP